MNAVVTAIVGGLLLLVLGWIKVDLNRLSDKIGHLDNSLSARIDELSQRVARIEGRLDEREHS